MSVIRETATLGGVAYDYTYSDAGRWLYAEAYDPLGSGREYEEGGPIPAEVAEQAASDVLAVLLGGTDD